MLLLALILALFAHVCVLACIQAFAATAGTMLFGESVGRREAERQLNLCWESG